MEQILYGAPVAKQLDEISLKIFQEVKSNNKTPHMTAITVGDNPASLLYVSRKKEKVFFLFWEKTFLETKLLVLRYSFPFYFSVLLIVSVLVFRSSFQFL